MGRLSGHSDRQQLREVKKDMVEKEPAKAKANSQDRPATEPQPQQPGEKDKENRKIWEKLRELGKKKDSVGRK